MPSALGSLPGRSLAPLPRHGGLGRAAAVLVLAVGWTLVLVVEMVALTGVVLAAAVAPNVTTEHYTSSYVFAVYLAVIVASVFLCLLPVALWQLYEHFRQ